MTNGIMQNDTRILITIPAQLLTTFLKITFAAFKVASTSEPEPSKI
jgi:hypothetical protein